MKHLKKFQLKFPKKIEGLKYDLQQRG